MKHLENCLLLSLLSFLISHHSILFLIIKCFSNLRPMRFGIRGILTNYNGLIPPCIKPHLVNL